eukprot:scaffold43663_cov32-Tisochrysis_lutea.AAC.2
MQLGIYFLRMDALVWGPPPKFSIWRTPFSLQEHVDRPCARHLGPLTIESDHCLTEANLLRHHRPRGLRQRLASPRCQVFQEWQCHIHIHVVSNDRELVDPNTALPGMEAGGRAIRHQASG